MEATKDTPFVSRASLLARLLARKRGMLERERWPRDRIEAEQHRLLGAMVEHASTSSRFYRRLYGGSLKTDEVDLRALPVITKSQWMEHFDEVVVDSRLRLSELEEYVRTIRGDQRWLGRYRVMASSGSTGQRGIYVWSSADWRRLLAVSMRATERLGYGPRIPRLRLASISAPDAKHMTYRVGASLDAGVLRMKRLSATKPIRELASALQAFQPDIVTAYPSVAAMLAREQLAGRLSIQPSRIGVTGEIVTEDMRDCIVRAWQIEPINVYALTETGVAATTCEEGKLHLNEDALIFEAVDASGNPVPPGIRSDKVLVTSLLNRTQPIIRMEVTDQVTFLEEPCRCGRTLQAIEEVQGRSDDVLHLPAADGRTEVELHPIHLLGAMAAIPQVQAYQIQLARRILSVTAVIDGDDAVLGQIEAKISKVLKAQGIASVPVRVHRTARIEREPGGKLKLVRVCDPSRRAQSAAPN